MRVALTTQERELTAWLGARRYESAVANDVPNRAESRGLLLADYVLGVAGELAVAKGHNRYPRALGAPSGHPDVGTNIEVRCSRSGHLIVHTKDVLTSPPETLFVLAIPEDDPGVFSVSHPASKRFVMAPEYAEIAAQRCQYGIEGWWVPRSHLRWD